jgi:hypothetical protein
MANGKMRVEPEKLCFFHIFAVFAEKRIGVVRYMRKTVLFFRFFPTIHNGVRGFLPFPVSRLLKFMMALYV